MWDRGWSASHRLHGTRTIDNQRSDAAVENVFERDFSATVPNSKWVADITAIWTMEGWLSPAVVLDVFERKILWDGS